MRTTLLAAALAGAAIALAAPTANAASRDVWAGPPGAKAPAGLPHQGDANEFFPKAITIAQGDRLSWRSATFHTVTFPVLDEYPPVFAGLALNNPISGARDAAGLPFYFDGLPNLIVNPDVAAPTAGPTYDGRQLRNSGVLIGPKSAALRPQVHGARHVHLLLRHPPGDEGDGHGQAQGHARSPPRRRTSAA